MTKSSFILVLLFLGSCSSLPPVAYLDIAKVGYYSIFGYEEVNVTKELLEERKYSFAKAKIGNSKEIFIVLLSIEEGTFEWISQDKVRVFTDHGRIVRVSGIGRDSFIRQPISQKSLLDNKDAKIFYETIDLFNPDLFSSNLEREVLSIDVKKSTYLGEVLDVIELVERTQVKSIGWSAKNIYHYKIDGTPIMTTQEVHPMLPKIKLEFYYK